MTADVRAVPFWSDEEIERGLGGAIAHMRAQGVLAYPTETVYGFGGSVDSESVANLIALKGRPANKPFLLIVAASEMITRLGLHLTSYASRLAAGFWPGPLTLVLPGGEKQVPEQLRGPEGGIAVRWTPHRGLTRLVQAHGAPITSTSANRPGIPPATNASQILEQWPDAISRGQLHVLDGGQLVESAPSTVVDCTGARARVIRPGAIPVATLRAIVPDIVGDN
ncbi:MAG TPA: L-threonylcarbamoyladenylate synthase [Gemmatimonadaceae bacterium]|jgi:L-threonylcarbamoyladenylate synthase|nr:L-threonylcarbamoyladenylate synthase [Gemmatimonadaceae bacterium]